MIHNELDGDVFNITVKGGNSCQKKGMNRATPSKILQSNTGGGSGCSAGLIHVKRSDFFPSLKFPNWERDGG